MMFGIVVHWNPLLVPLQEPERCWPVGQVARSHGLHVPGLAPSRYLSALQTMFGIVVHLNPLLAPLQEPERCWPVGQVTRLQALHVPGLAPARYWLALQTMFAMGVHWYPLVAPPQVPSRRMPGPHWMFEQAKQAVSDVPEHPPLLYAPVPHVAHVLHVPADVGE